MNYSKNLRKSAMAKRVLILLGVAFGVGLAVGGVSVYALKTHITAKDKEKSIERTLERDNTETNYVAFNDKINAEIDSFADAKEQIIKEIRGLRDKNYVQVLYKVYVQYKTVKQASKEMKKCYNYTVELHNKALAAFEKTYQNLHYLM